jgi:hypothetical protein
MLELRPQVQVRMASLLAQLMLLVISPMILVLLADFSDAQTSTLQKQSLDSMGSQIIKKLSTEVHQWIVHIWD